MASADLDRKAKSFTTMHGKGSVYVYRNESLGGALAMTVSMNGKVVGQTGPNTYFWFNLKPGKYSIESHAENVSTLPLIVEQGKQYFVWQEMKMGMWMARTMLQQVSEEAGKKGVRECRMLAAVVPDDDMSPLEEVAGKGDVTQKLRDLQKMRDDGVISEAEYAEKHKQLLERY